MIVRTVGRAIAPIQAIQRKPMQNTSDGKPLSGAEASLLETSSVQPSAVKSPETQAQPLSNRQGKSGFPANGTAPTARVAEAFKSGDPIAMFGDDSDAAVGHTALVLGRRMEGCTPLEKFHARTESDFA